MSDILACVLATIGLLIVIQYLIVIAIFSAGAFPTKKLFLLWLIPLFWIPDLFLGLPSYFRKIWRGMK